MINYLQFMYMLLFSFCVFNFSFMHFRNLFHRTKEFLANGVNLVFVLDGRAPEIKSAALRQRQEAAYGNSSGKPNLARSALANSSEEVG